METWAGCAFPDDVLYNLQGDTWVRFESPDLAVIGMNDVSQTRCGRLVHVGWKSPSKRVERGRPICVIESSKWVGPMRSPLTGVIVENNQEAFAKDIAIANRDPYGTGWFYRMRIEEASERDQLADASAAFEHYRKIIDESNLRCFRCEN